MSTIPETPSQFQLTFEGRMAEQHRVPAAMLAQALSGMQRALYLAALEHEAIEVRQRDRVAGELAYKYQLLASPPEPGSLRVPLSLTTDVELLSPVDLPAVGNKFRNILSAINDGAADRLAQLIPDRIRRKRLLDAVKSMLPRSGSGVRLYVSNGTGKPVLASDQAEREIRSLATSISPRAVIGDVRTVTGQLMKMDFTARTLSLLYPPTERELKCHYADPFEESLLENPRGLIHVTGVASLDQDDNPVEMREVYQVEPVDDSEFYIDEFILPDGKRLAFQDGQPRTLRPDHDEGFQLYLLRDDDLGIDTFAYTRDELEEELHANMAMLWNVYAMGDPERMDKSAVEFRNRLRQTLVEKDKAANAAG